VEAAPIDLGQSSSAEYSNIQELNERVWALTPGNPSAFAIAIKGIPSSGFISLGINTARLSSEDYIVSGYLSNVAYRQLEFGDPQRQPDIFNNLSLLGKPSEPYWVYVPSDDWTSATWERPEGETFTQQFSNALSQLQSAHGLRPNWDSYGAMNPSTIVISRSFILLWNLYGYFTKLGESLPEPFVAPVPDGRIQFEWEAGNIEFEVTIDEQGKMEYLLSECNGKDRFAEGIVETERELGNILLSKLLRRGTRP